jgi:hypothetical protein
MAIDRYQETDLAGLYLSRRSVAAEQVFDESWSWG